MIGAKVVSHGRDGDLGHLQTELWHTRVVLPADGGAADAAVPELNDNHTAPIRAIWSPDYAPPGTPSPPRTRDFPFTSSLKPLDRHSSVATVHNH